MARKTSSSSDDKFCQKCRQFEVDLTNTSDELSATDAELKASRQVINLLQRQLEIFRLEKESLEKIIVQNDIIEPVADCEKNLKPRDDNGPLINLDSGDTLQPISKVFNKKEKLLTIIHSQVYTKESEIANLKTKLSDVNNQNEQYRTELNSLREELDDLKSQNSVLKENLALRDKTIVSLSNEVFEQGISDRRDHNGHRLSIQDEVTTSHRALKNAQMNITKLVDTLDAYKKTNELLSNNVIKLNERCVDLERKEIEARSQSQELEAKCCQIQSKLLSLLKEIGQQSGDNLESGDSAEQDTTNRESVRLLIQRLLEDKSLEIPLSWKEGNRGTKQPTHREIAQDDKLANSKYECDELGFYFVTMDESSNQVDVNARGEIFRTKQNRVSTSPLDPPEEIPSVSVFDQAASENVRRNILRHMSIDSNKNDERSWRLKWDEFIKDMSRIDLEKSKEFKSLLRSGVPQEYRCKVWKALVDLRVRNIREKYGPDYYQSLLEPNRKPRTKAKKALNPASKQIELDLLRTLPNNKHFETIESSGTVRLRRVLIAYSEHNPKVGYCQGMNRLAAVALLVLPEEEAFWCLATIVDQIMPDGYYNNLWLAQVDSNVVMSFLAIKIPDLSDHFKRCNIELSLFAWFLTIFVDGTPPALFLRLWDSFLYEGDKVLFRVALAILKMFDRQLLKLTNSVAVNNFLRSNINAPMDVDYFFSIAFEWVNPLSSRSLKMKRQQNLQQIKSNMVVIGNSSTPTVEGSDSDDDPKMIGEDHNYDDSSVISI